MSALIPSSTPSSTTLIPTTTGTLAGVEQTLVDARTLHKHLGVGKMFANWIKDRIETYGFSEGSDFLPKLAKTPGLFGGRPKTEYLLSLEVAKSSNVIRTHKLNIYSPAYVVDMRPNNDGSGVLTVRCRADAEQIPKKGLNFKRRCDLNAHLLMHYAVTGEEEPNPSMIWIGETSS